MRITIPALVLTALAAGCTERSIEAISGSPDAPPRDATVRIVVEDDAGAVRVVEAGARPTVTLVVALGDPRAATDAPGGSAVAVQAAVDSSAATRVLLPAAVVAAAGGTVRLTIVAATLAVPGAFEAVDMLGGSGARLTRTVALGRHDGALVVDLNSARWLTPVARPSPGEPAYHFNGPAAFLDALDIHAR
jgi:hypothetical protein